MRRPMAWVRRAWRAVPAGAVALALHAAFAGNRFSAFRAE